MSQFEPQNDEQQAAVTREVPVQPGDHLTPAEHTGLDSGNGHGSGDYAADKIKVLEGLEAVRKRPGMYIGRHGRARPAPPASTKSSTTRSTKRSPATAKNDQRHASTSTTRVTVDDDGRGIPDRASTRAGISAVEVVMTKLHAGGKFDDEGSAYKVSGGLHGVGAVGRQRALRKL